MKTIVLADDHPLLLKGYAEFITGLKIVEMATAGNTAYNAIVKHEPDVALLDYNMPFMNGLEIAKLVYKHNIKTKIIVLTMYKEEAIINEIGKSIFGYVLKNDPLSVLDECIKKVLVGEYFVSNNILNFSNFNEKSSVHLILTPSEIKILKLLANDMSSNEIANELFLSKRTIEKHRSNIITKLGIKSSQNALLIWVKENINTIED
jgi:DNA-binding NarL/FixJ family response regulator